MTAITDISLSPKRQEYKSFLAAKAQLATASGRGPGRR
jgi:hypothetical protein